MTGGRRHHLVGTIASVGFASGDRFVAGLWDRSPIGPITDVMWARPSGERLLLAQDAATARFVASLYTFEEVRVVPCRRAVTDTSVVVEAGDLRLSLLAGPGWRLPAPWRPPWVTRWLEAPLARLLLGVRAYGVTPAGAREWYQARTYRRVRDATGQLGGRDLGAARRLRPPCRFGFSEPPAQPSLVRLRVVLEGVPEAAFGP